jgi:hypothetical protein
MAAPQAMMDARKELVLVHLGQAEPDGARWIGHELAPYMPGKE